MDIKNLSLYISNKSSPPGNSWGSLQQADGAGTACADVCHVAGNMRHSGLAGFIHPAFIIFELQAAGFGFLDVPIETPGDLAQPQGVACRQSVKW
jgi:hypothetical protein